MMTMILTQVCLRALGVEVRHSMWRSGRPAQGNVEDFF
jgi:hypothetical protein